MSTNKGKEAWMNRKSPTCWALIPDAENNTTKSNNSLCTEQKLKSEEESRALVAFKNMPTVIWSFNHAYQQQS